MTTHQFKAPFDPKADDPKLARIIKPGMDGDVVIVGFPYDEGCTRNGGRAGAKEAPAYFERLLGVCGTVVNPEFGIDLTAATAPKVSHGGSINPSLPLEVAHKHLEETVEKIIRGGKIPFVVGGGNDQAAANGRALLSAAAKNANGKTNVAMINVDAHLDVRPPLADGRVHSGTPFLEMLQDGRFDGTLLAEFSSQGRVCSNEHAKYVASKGGRCVWLSTIRSKYPSADVAFKELLDSFPADTKIFINFNMDSIVGSDCPGVSAPAAMGLSSYEALNMCKVAGENPNVVLMDLSELNPVVEDYRSPRLAVFMFYYFLLGVAVRRQNAQS